VSEVFQNQLNNTVTSEQITIDQALDYEKKRFSRRYRMRRLDRLERDFAKKVFEMVGGDSHIIDIPCGNGRFFGIFSKARKLTMVDYSGNMLAAAKEKSGTPENVEFIQADISKMPLPDNCAELCFCMRLFHHMKNDQVRLQSLKELVRISKRYVALSFYNRNCLRFYLRKILGKKIRGNYVTFSHIIDLAGQAGLGFVQRTPKFNLFEQQCLVILEKVQNC
jgi:ubiquinone/menaquinone biosynthesis C-methylase UbiE